MMKKDLHYEVDIKGAPAETKGTTRIEADGDGERVHANYCLVAVFENALSARRNDIIDAMKARRIGTSPSAIFPKQGRTSGNSGS